MKKLKVIVFLLLCTSGIFAQSKTDSIEIRKNFFGTTFRQNGKILTPKQLKNIVMPYNEAYNEMKKAELNKGVGFIFGFTGGFLIGWPLGTSMAGKKADWSLAAIGAGLIVLSVPFNIATVKHTKNAVNIYNTGLKQKAMNQIDVNFGLNSDGIGMVVRF